MNSVLKLSSIDRALLFQETAAKIGIHSPVIVEKDFWVSWLLKQLFQGGSSPPSMIFKGGTSLSKAFNLIKRFSEDCDITFSAISFGFSESPEKVAQFGSKQRKRFFDSLFQATIQHITQKLLPNLSQICAAELKQGWRLELDPLDSEVILFYYPKALEEKNYPNSAYIKPSIRLEFGSRGAITPHVHQRLGAYVHDAFPELCSDVLYDLPILDPKRTFWEKITLLHQLAHWPEEKQIRKELARHYYDVAIMVQSSQGDSFLNSIHLLSEVTKHKAIYFSDTKASYETAKIGSLVLLPSQKRLKQLGKDYSDMREMFFGVPPSFSELKDTVERIEFDINFTVNPIIPC